MSDIIFGKNSVYEYLENLDGGQKLYVQESLDKNKIKTILNFADRKNIKVEYVSKGKLDSLTKNANHQGLVLETKPYTYYDLEDIIEAAYHEDRDPLLVILDEITDPHNLGAIIRTAEAAGANGVIIPKHRSAAVNQTVHKTSAGATSHMKVAMVTNINQTIDKIQKEGYWVYGADGYADKFYDEIDYRGKVAIVIGNEGKGISRLTKEKCDDLVKIPMLGKTESLNASTSAAIILYGVLNNRKKG